MAIDTAEAVLLFVLLILTILLIVLGIQVFFILREFRKTVHKANKVLDETNIITKSVSGPISHLSSLGKASTLLTAVKVVRGIIEKDKPKEKTEK